MKFSTFLSMNVLNPNKIQVNPSKNRVKATFILFLTRVNNTTGAELYSIQQNSILYDKTLLK